MSHSPSNKDRSYAGHSPLVRTARDQNYSSGYSSSRHGQSSRYKGDSDRSSYGHKGSPDRHDKSRYNSHHHRSRSRDREDRSKGRVTSSWGHSYFNSHQNDANNPKHNSSKESEKDNLAKNTNENGVSSSCSQHTMSLPKQTFPCRSQHSATSPAEPSVSEHINKNGSSSDRSVISSSDKTIKNMSVVNDSIKDTNTLNRFDNDTKLQECINDSKPTSVSRSVDNELFSSVKDAKASKMASLFGDDDEFEAVAEETVKAVPLLPSFPELLKKSIPSHKKTNDISLIKSSKNKESSCSKTGMKSKADSKTLVAIDIFRTESTDDKDCSKDKKSCKPFLDPILLKTSLDSVGKHRKTGSSSSSKISEKVSSKNNKIPASSEKFVKKENLSEKQDVRNRSQKSVCSSRNNCDKPVKDSNIKKEKEPNFEDSLHVDSLNRKNTNLSSNKSLLSENKLPSIKSEHRKTNKLKDSEIKKSSNSDTNKIQHEGAVKSADQCPAKSEPSVTKAKSDHNFTSNKLCLQDLFGDVDDITTDTSSANTTGYNTPVEHRALQRSSSNRNDVSRAKARNYIPFKGHTHRHETSKPSPLALVAKELLKSSKSASEYSSNHHGGYDRQATATSFSFSDDPNYCRQSKGANTIAPTRPFFDENIYALTTPSRGLPSSQANDALSCDKLRKRKSHSSTDEDDEAIPIFTLVRKSSRSPYQLGDESFAHQPEPAMLGHQTEVLPPEALELPFSESKPFSDLAQSFIDTSLRPPSPSFSFPKRAISPTTSPGAFSPSSPAPFLPCDSDDDDLAMPAITHPGQ